MSANSREKRYLQEVLSNLSQTDDENLSIIRSDNFFQKLFKLREEGIIDSQVISKIETAINENDEDSIKDYHDILQALQDGQIPPSPQVVKFLFRLVNSSQRRKEGSRNCNNQINR